MDFIRTALRRYFTKNLALYAAALSFYTILAIGPMFFLLVFFGSYFVPGFELQIKNFLATVFEESAAPLVRFIEGYSFSPDGIISAAVGIIFVLFIATRLVNILQSALNTVFEREGATGMVKRRLLSLLLLILAGVAVIAVFVLQLFLASATSGVWLSYMSSIIGVLVIFLVLALAYALLPHPSLRWSAAMRSAFLSTAFLVLGESIVNWFVVPTGRYEIGSAVILLLLWTYYNWHAFLLGAQVAQAWEG